MSYPQQILPVALVVAGLLPAAALAQTPPEFKLVPIGIAAGEELGAASAVSGNLAVFGAPEATGGGAVYVYRQTGGLWVEEQRLTGSDADNGDQFGLSLATDGTHIAIGAPWQDWASFADGAVYVFSHDGVAWVEDQKLTASDAASSDLFGDSVTLSGSTIVVGSPRDDDDGNDSGAAYVFENQGAGIGWVETRKLTASDASAGSRFGESCALSGIHLLVGAHLEDEAASDAGAVYAFADSGAGMVETQKLLPEALPNRWFGISAAIQGNRAVIGAPANAVSQWGTAYVVEYDGGQWVQQAHLEPLLQGSVGKTVALDQDTVLVGAPNATAGASFDGIAVAYRKIGANWFESMRIAAKDGVRSDHLAESVALSSGTALLGAYLRDEGGLTSTGAIYGQTTQFTLTATPSAPLPGDTMTLAAFSGVAATPLLIAVTQVDGIPLFQKLVFTTFTNRHRFDLPLTVPSGLSGIRIDMQAFKLGAPGGTETSSVASVDFQ